MNVNNELNPTVSPTTCQTQRESVLHAPRKATSRHINYRVERSEQIQEQVFHQPQGVVVAE